jgi:hypothetical protein
MFERNSAIAPEHWLITNAAVSGSFNYRQLISRCVDSRSLGILEFIRKRLAIQHHGDCKDYWWRKAIGGASDVGPDLSNTVTDLQRLSGLAVITLA